jgi:FkbM family methyltransferase
MNAIIKQISERISSAQNKMGFLDVLFGTHKQEAFNGTPVVLFGAGGLGKELCSTLKHNGISPVCFCDNDGSKSGSLYCGIPVISFDELKKSHQGSLIVVSTQKHLKSVTKQLLENGFRADRVLCKESDLGTNLVFMYSMIGTQSLLTGFKQQYAPRTLLDVLWQNEQKVLDAYTLFADRKSKELLLAKLALLASDENFELFKHFILTFSEPILEFGIFNYEGTTEDYYYFNNDVFSLSQNEVLVDVGAFDGDTVQTFVHACSKHHLDYKRIYAFEPDPQCYKALRKNTSAYKNIFCHQLGLWSESKVLRFMTSDNAIHDQAGAISNIGDVEIQVVSLDDFLQGEEVTFIKMDPGGNIIPEVIRGATGAMAKYRPKLALGAYHSLEAIFDIPLLVKSICPEYKLYLRHSTYHLCDTDLFATI